MSNKTNSHDPTEVHGPACWPCCCLAVMQPPRMRHKTTTKLGHRADGAARRKRCGTEPWPVCHGAVPRSSTASGHGPSFRASFENDERYDGQPVFPSLTWGEATESQVPITGRHCTNVAADMPAWSRHWGSLSLARLFLRPTLLSRLPWVQVRVPGSVGGLAWALMWHFPPRRFCCSPMPPGAGIRGEKQNSWNGTTSVQSASVEFLVMGQRTCRPEGPRKSSRTRGMDGTTAAYGPVWHVWACWVGPPCKPALPSACSVCVFEEGRGI